MNICDINLPVRRRHQRRASVLENITSNKQPEGDNMHAENAVRRTTLAPTSGNEEAMYFEHVTWRKSPVSTSREDDNMYV